MFYNDACVTLGDLDILTEEELKTFKARRITWSCKGKKWQGYKKQRFACIVESTESALEDLIKDMEREKMHDIKIDGRKIS